MYTALPAEAQTSPAVQYSSAEHPVVARQEDGAWQVGDSPEDVSLQVVKPPTVEQSDVVAQVTKLETIKLVLIPHKLTVCTCICKITELYRRTSLCAS